MKRETKAKAGFVGVKKRGRAFQLTEAGRKRLPEVPESMRAEIDQAREKHKTRKASPGARVYVSGKDDWFIDTPHRDLEAWEVQICEAFGTRSHSVMWTFLNQLAALCRRKVRRDGDEYLAWAPDEYELNFILGTIAAETPDTPLQAAMLAQMCANHLMQMRIGADLLGLGGNFLPPERVATFAKLTNAFANQTEAYLRLRGKAPARQSVEVTYRREVHIHHHRREHLHPGGGEDFSKQPQEAIEATYVEKPGAEGLSAGEPPRRPALRSPEQAGVVVPMRSLEGKDPLPTARRAIPGRAKG